MKIIQLKRKVRPDLTIPFSSEELHAPRDPEEDVSYIVLADKMHISTS
jgi:hypothetical protein